jgi:hypothetical protein
MDHNAKPYQTCPPFAETTTIVCRSEMRVKDKHPLQLRDPTPSPGARNPTNQGISLKETRKAREKKGESMGNYEIDAKRYMP